MTRAKFYAMKLDFAELIRLENAYPNSKDYGFLVFQNDSDDTGPRTRNEFILTAYRVGDDFSVKSPFDSTKLTTDTSSQTLDQHGKIFLGNLPLSRSRIKKDFIDHDPDNMIDHLYLKPTPFGSNNRYVCYEIIPIFKDPSESKALASSTLNPSPPAPPQ